MPDSGERTLAGIGLFASLPQEDRQALEQRCHWRKFAANEQIIDRQSETREVFFVVRGKVRVVDYSLSGREVSFDDIAQGGSFGELAAIDKQPRSANVVALTDTTVAVLPPSVFTRVVTEHPAVALALMQRLAQIIRAATERIMDLSTLGAHNRVHAELLRQAGDSTREDGTAVIQPIPIHADIASRVSTTRETVARVLSDLARDGIVKRESGALVILDVDRLRTMVEQFKGQ